MSSCRCEAFNGTDAEIGDRWQRTSCNFTNWNLCTLCRCKSTPTRSATMLWMTSHYGRTVVKSVTEISIHFSFDSALCNLGGNFSQGIELCSRIRSTDMKGCPWPLNFEPEINSLRQMVKDYCCAKFQVLPIREFRSIMLKCISTPTYISWQSDRHIHAAVLRHRRG